MEATLLALLAVVSSFAISLVINWAILKGVLKVISYKSPSSTPDFSQTLPNSFPQGSILSEPK